MSDDVNSNEQPIERVVWKKSWTAYFWPVVIWGLFWWFGTGKIRQISPGFGTGLILVATVWLILKCLYLRTVYLYYDAYGVWAHRGLFPWTRGSYGVQWRDVDMASFQRGFFGWFFKSYTVIVRNRYKPAPEIYLNHIHLGIDACTEINTYLSSLVAPQVVQYQEEPTQV